VEILAGLRPAFRADLWEKRFPQIERNVTAGNSSPVNDGSAAVLITSSDAWREIPTARTLRFKVPDWPDHLAGQHVDLRLTAEDGYMAQRSYSMSAPEDGEFVEVTVQLVPDGEVSPYLVKEITIGDAVEVLGPLGGWFV